MAITALRSRRGAATHVRRRAGHRRVVVELGVTAARLRVVLVGAAAAHVVAVEGVTRVVVAGVRILVGTRRRRGGEVVLVLGAAGVLVARGGVLVISDG